MYTVLIYTALLYHWSITYYTTVLLLQCVFCTLPYCIQHYVCPNRCLCILKCSILYISQRYSVLLQCSILYISQRHSVLLQCDIDVLLYYRIMRFYCTAVWHIAIIFYYCIPTTEFSYSIVYYCTLYTAHCPLRLCASASAPRTAIHRRVLCDARRRIVREGVRLYVCRSMIDWQCMMGASSWVCISCISTHLEGWILFSINYL